MKGSIGFLLSAVSFVSLLQVQQASARPPVRLAQNTVSSDKTEDVSEPGARTADREGRSVNQSNSSPLYLRIQQAPLIGLAAVSDSGVIDLELMKVVNRYFWIGPTIVAHADESGDTKMRSLNLGVRADFVLPAFGNVDEGVYISSALLFGTYTSKTYTTTKQYGALGQEPTSKVTCDYKSQGAHRAGAFVIGKQFHLNDDLHLTAGLGVVKSKVMSKTESGMCEDDTVTESEGRALPWLDLGVGFRI